MTLKPIQFQQLCMVVKTVLQRNPSIDDAEWKAKAHETLVKMGFQLPEPGMLSRAMTQVERALLRTIGPRPLRPLPTGPGPAPVTPLPRRFEGRTNRPAGWDILVKLMARLPASSAFVESSPGRPNDPELLSISEPLALDEFWAASRDEATDRLKLLRAFAEIAIVRPASWDQRSVRAHAGDHTLAANGCFACGARRGCAWHHVIQIQHGGSNYLRNLVSVCEACHLEIHPWLREGQVTLRTVAGFTQVSECAESALRLLEQRKVSA